jgi:glycine/D-amino acid oxidase-like deaminating enzyme
MKKPYDYIIVGGGMAGLSCAYWIKKLKKKARIAIVEKGEIRNQDAEKQLCNLTVGSLNHLYRIYKLQGIEAVVKVYKHFEDNLSLLESELEVLERNAYVSLYDGGTINLMENGSASELGSFQSFVHELEKNDFPVKEIKDDGWEFGVKYSHDGNYEAQTFIDKVWDKLGEDVDVYEKSTCKRIGRELDDIVISTAGGEHIVGNKIILANSNSLSILLPELKSQLDTVDSMIYKFDAEINNLELVNYANHKNDDYFVKLKGGYYYAQHGNLFGEGKDLDEDLVSKSFEDFSNKSFPGAEADKAVKTKIAYTSSGIPLTGQSKKTPNLYYLGGFSGQSKLYAFKMAKELIETMK